MLIILIGPVMPQCSQWLYEWTLKYTYTDFRKSLLTVKPAVSFINGQGKDDYFYKSSRAIYLTAQA